MSFMGICSLYTGYNYVHYSLVGKMRLPFIDSDLLYGGVSLLYLSRASKQTGNHDNSDNIIHSMVW